MAIATAISTSHHGTVPAATRISMYAGAPSAVVLEKDGLGSEFGNGCATFRLMPTLRLLGVPNPGRC